MTQATTHLEPPSAMLLPEQKSDTAGRTHEPFWELVKGDYQVNGRDWTRPGFRAAFMYRFGVWRMSVRSRLLRAPLSLLYRWMHRHVRNCYGIELHYTATIGSRFRIAHQGGIVIHEFARIGNNCTVRQGVTLGAANKYSVEEAPVLEDNVDIGAGAIVMGKVTVGDGARIGANAVVMSDVPPGSTAFAQPARIVQPPKSGAPN